MAQFVYPTLAQIELVNLLKVPFATATIHLCSSQVTLTPTLQLAALTAAEATFTGYAAVTLTAIPAAYSDPVNGGISNAIPLTQFNTASPYTVGNDIWGGWIEDAASNLLVAWMTSAAWGMQGAGNSLPLNLLLNFFGLTGNALYVSYGDTPQ
jgi:hypothetical protein